MRGFFYASIVVSWGFAWLFGYTAGVAKGEYFALTYNPNCQHQECVYKGITYDIMGGLQ